MTILEKCWDLSFFSRTLDVELCGWESFEILEASGDLSANMLLINRNWAT